MTELIYRTEDIRLEDIPDLYVRTTTDERIVKLLTSTNPVLLVGSRGTGKSFLMRVAESILNQGFQNDRVLPVYVSFARSSLLHTSDPMQFRNWMLARLCTRIRRCLMRRGLLIASNPSMSILSGGDAGQGTDADTGMDRLAKAYEESYRSPGSDVDAAIVPELEDFRDAMEDLCEALDIPRVAVFFDEAAHIFRPEQQRQFFTLFRDLRSPFFSCNAAIYPGVTSFGPTFQLAHDATEVHIDRDVLDPNYAERMREIVLKQAPSELANSIMRNEGNFRVLAYAASGNPRLLLKTVARTPSLGSRDTNTSIKEFYRTDIWSEHSNLRETYAGHRALVDWGREFVEEAVLPDTKGKNDSWRKHGRGESTCYFWVHRDAPEVVREALRLLSYTGIITEHVANIRATRAELGTRYAVNLGCLYAIEPIPTNIALDVARDLTTRRFTEYGANHATFARLSATVPDFEEVDMADVLMRQLRQPASVLDITQWQKERLNESDFNTVEDVLRATEYDLQRIHYVGPKRARRIKNAATAPVLEYLSG